MPWAFCGCLVEVAYSAAVLARIAPNDGHGRLCARGVQANGPEPGGRCGRGRGDRGSSWDYSESAGLVAADPRHIARP